MNTVVGYYNIINEEDCTQSIQCQICIFETQEGPYNARFRFGVLFSGSILKNRFCYKNILQLICMRGSRKFCQRGPSLTTFF